jgi:hypothetical protein
MTRPRCLTFAWAVALAAGCGPPPRVAQMTGTVTLDGKPLVKHSLYFVAPDLLTRTQVRNGKYLCPEVPTGPVQVYLVPDPDAADADEAKQPLKFDKFGTPIPPAVKPPPRLPAKYYDKANPPFRLEVKPGGNEHNFELTSN